MNIELLTRALGAAGPQVFQQAEKARQLNSLQAAPNVHFDGRSENPSHDRHSKSHDEDGQGLQVWAHPAGVNCLVVDRFEGR